MIRFICKIYQITYKSSQKLPSFLDPHQCSALDPLGAHSITPPKTPTCFSKTAMPKFRLDTSLSYYIFSGDKKLLQVAFLWETGVLFLKSLQYIGKAKIIKRNCFATQGVLLELVLLKLIL